MNTTEQNVNLAVHSAVRLHQIDNLIKEANNTDSFDVAMDYLDEVFDIAMMQDADFAKQNSMAWLDDDENE